MSLLPLLAQSRGGNVQFLLELVFFVLVFFSSVIGWALKKLKERAEVRRAERNQMAQRREMLRTGQGLSSTAPAPRPVQDRASAQEEAVRRLQEIARRRREELEALARQAQQAARTKAPGSKTPPPAPVPRQRMGLPPELDPSRSMLKRAPARPQPPRSAPFPTPAKVREKPQKHQQPRRETPSQPQRAPSISPAAILDQPRAEAAAVTGTSIAALARLGTNPTDLRRAIVLSEVLGKPVSLRELNRTSRVEPLA